MVGDRLGGGEIELFLAAEMEGMADRLALAALASARVLAASNPTAPITSIAASMSRARVCALRASCPSSRCSFAVVMASLRIINEFIRMNLSSAKRIVGCTCRGRMAS